MKRTTYYYMSENFDVPPFFSTGQFDEDSDVAPDYVKLMVNVLPMRGEPNYWAIVTRRDWRPLWDRLADADRKATAVIAGRDAKYERALKVPLVGKLLGAFHDADTANAYYEVERASWAASRELLLLVDRYATGDQKLYSQRFLNTGKTGIGRWVSDRGPTRP